MLRLLRVVLPKWIKEAFRAQLVALKQPRMIHGYKDASGAYRTKTRISDTTFVCHPEKVFIGDNVFVGHYTIIDGTGGLNIGEGVQIAALVGIFTHGSHISIRLLGRHYLDIPECERPGFKTAPINIGRYAYIGAGAKILPGVAIGDGALISAGSLVVKDVPDFAIVRGSPAEIVGSTRDLDKPYLEDEQVRRWYEEWQEKSQTNESC